MNETNLTITVTKIKRRWHARLWLNGIVKDESACELKADVGWMCREMLRWFDKLGGVSKYAAASRRRNRNAPGPIGKVWYKATLDEEASKRAAKNAPYADRPWYDKPTRLPKRSEW